MHSWPSASPRWSPLCCNGAYIHYIYSNWNKMANMVGGGLPFVPTHLSARSAPFRADRVSFWGNVPRFRCNLGTPQPGRRTGETHLLGRTPALVLFSALFPPQNNTHCACVSSGAVRVCLFLDYFSSSCAMGSSTSITTTRRFFLPSLSTNLPLASRSFPRTKGSASKPNPIVSS